jgi:hypothetical protein
VTVEPRDPWPSRAAEPLEGMKWPARRCLLLMLGGSLAAWVLIAGALSLIFS